MSRLPGDLLIKDPQSVEPYTFDWTEYLEELGVGVLIETSVFYIDPIGGENPSVLEMDDDEIVTGNLKARVFISGGTMGKSYWLTNRITTNSTPVVTDDRSVKVKIASR